MYENHKLTIHGREFDAVKITNITAPGSCGPDELLYTLQGGYKLLHLTEDDIYQLIRTNDLKMEKLTTIDRVRQWGTSKGIIGTGGKATEFSQFTKLLEEVTELSVAIQENNEAEKIDAIGDCMVVLILLSEIVQTPLEACLESAYGVISKRTGKMVDGKFVKDA